MPLKICIYGEGNGYFILYDDGKTFNFEDEDFSKTELAVKNKNGELSTSR